MENLGTWVIGILTISVMVIIAWKSHIFQKLIHGFNTSKKLLITIGHSKRLAIVDKFGPKYSEYEISVKILNSGNFRVIISSINIVDDFEKVLYPVEIPGKNKVIESSKQTVLKKTIPLENNPLLDKISSGSFQVIVTDIEGKTYLGRP